MVPPTIQAAVAVHRPMQLNDLTGPRLLVQAVNILGNDRRKFPSLLQGNQRTMTSIGPGLRMDEVGAVEVEELRRMLNQTAVTEHVLRGEGQVMLSGVKPASRAKVRNT